MNNNLTTQHKYPCKYCGDTLFGGPNTWHDEYGFEKCDEAPKIHPYHEPTTERGELIAALENIRQAFVVNGKDAEYFFDHTWNRNAHIEVTLTIADARMVFAVLSRALRIEKGGASNE